MLRLTPAAGEVTPRIVEDVLCLVGIVVLADTAKDWTQDQRNQVYDYAIRLHLRASDNSRVRLAPKPEFL